MVPRRGIEPLFPEWKSDVLTTERTGHLWCRLSESNQSPTDYKSVALPDELKRHSYFFVLSLSLSDISYNTIFYIFCQTLFLKFFKIFFHYIINLIFSIYFHRLFFKNFFNFLFTICSFSLHIFQKIFFYIQFFFYLFHLFYNFNIFYSIFMKNFLNIF